MAAAEGAARAAALFFLGPRGQVLPAGQTSPEMAPSRAVDFELEMVRGRGEGLIQGNPRSWGG